MGISTKIKSYIKQRLSPKGARRLAFWRSNLRAIPYGFQLPTLARIYGTDKGMGHQFMRHYQTHLRRFKFKRLRMLEIGVGGYEDPLQGGASLRMWRRYFPFGQIWAIDIHEKQFHAERRIHIRQGSQREPAFLKQLYEEMGRAEVIIDDGSHFVEDVILSFEVLFPLLETGGIYVIEDTQTSYWEVCGGSNDRVSGRNTMNYFKKLAAGLNFREYPEPGYTPGYFDLHIVSIHYYHNLIFIY